MSQIVVLTVPVRVLSTPSVAGEVGQGRTIAVLGRGIQSRVATPLIVFPGVVALLPVLAVVVPVAEEPEAGIVAAVPGAVGGVFEATWRHRRSHPALRLAHERPRGRPIALAL